MSSLTKAILLGILFAAMFFGCFILGGITLGH